MTTPYAVQIANKGWKQALEDDPELKKGLNIVDGKIVYEDVAEAFDMTYTPIDEVM
ncbi:MAG: hypothetical protein R3220_11880 [Balneolaceae bacterium]|nr:hypothetical protein [Balneolaceae bacterium]